MPQTDMDKKLEICLSDMKICDEIAMNTLDNAIKIRNMAKYNDALKNQHDRRVQEEANALLNQMLNGNETPETEGAGSLVYKSS